MVTKRKLALVSALTSTIVLVRAASQSASLDALLDPPHHATDRPTDDATPVLSLDEAVRLSLVDQPILSGHEAVINANERQAIAAAQLPDPKLSGGLKELPVDTREAFSLRRDNFTEFTVGLSQEFPRADKRPLKGERKQLDAETQRAAIHIDRRAIRRDVSLASLAVHDAQQ